MTASNEQLTAGDYVGAILAAIAAFSPLLLFVYGPVFLRMYEDLGSELPAITKLVIQPWLGPALAILPIGALMLGVIDRGASLKRRRARIIGAFVAGSLVSALALYALYLPMFALADNIN